MCGLAGGLSIDLSRTEREVIRTLVGMSYYRGSHSTGMMSWARKVLPPHASVKEKAEYNPLHYYKSVSHPLDFISLEFPDAEKKFWDTASPTFIAGHTRHATVGGIIKANAHPFNFSPIYGMHNGTIAGDWYDDKKYKTDSEALYAMMQEKGLHKTLETIHELGTSPAYALVWFDKTDESLNFLRNYQRPLSIATLASGRTWYWASDAELLRWVMFQHKIAGYTIKELPVNEHWKVDLRASELKFEQQEELPDACKWKQYKGHVPMTYKNDKVKDDSYYTKTKNQPEDYGGVDNPEYYIRFGKKVRDVYFSEWDVKSGRFLSPLQFAETTRWRQLAELKKSMQLELDKEKKETSNAANSNFQSTKGIKTSTGSTTKSRFDKTGESSKPVRGLKDKNVIPLFPAINNNSVATELTHRFGPTNTKCTASEWYMKTKDGCVWCSNPVLESSQLFWGDNTTFLCDTCCEKVEKKDPEANDILNMYPPAYNLLPDKHTTH